MCQNSGKKIMTTTRVVLNNVILTVVLPNKKCSKRL